MSEGKKMNALENGKRQMITDLEKHPFPTCSGKRTIFLATMFCWVVSEYPKLP